jgi:hypothetical protein
MTRRFFKAMTLILLGACGESASTQDALVGTFTLTEIHCNGGPVFAPLSAWLTPPNTVKLTSSDGSAVTALFSDGSCTMSYPYTYAYPEAGTMSSTGAGNVTCSPSVAACAALSNAIEGKNVCGWPVYTGTNTGLHTPIPAAAGGIVTTTATDGFAATACSANGMQDPLTYTWKKE